VSYGVAIGVVLAQPMYPYNKSTPEMVEGNPIDIDPDVLDELGVDKLEAIFSPSEVVGGWTPEDEWADAPSAQEVDS
jgi:hypothetical protein